MLTTTLSFFVDIDIIARFVRDGKTHIPSNQMPLVTDHRQSQMLPEVNKQKDNCQGSCLLSRINFEDACVRLRLPHQPSRALAPTNHLATNFTLSSNAIPRMFASILTSPFNEGGIRSRESGNALEGSY